MTKTEYLYGKDFDKKDIFAAARTFKSEYVRKRRGPHKNTYKCEGLERRGYKRQ